MERKSSILVVDDDSFSLGAASALLEEYGYAVVACPGGAEALAAVDEHPFDAVLTDVKMPGISGIELLEALCGRFPEIPVILMTAYGDHDTAVEAIRKGAFDLIIKPYRPVQLFHSVQKAVHFRAMELDISARKRTEETLRKTQAELVRAYAELKTAHGQALQSEKLASIGQLAAGVAHEINNPVGFITSNLGTLKKYAERLLSVIDAQKEALEKPAEGASEEVHELWRTQKVDHIRSDLLQLIEESIDGADRIRTIVQSLKNFSRSDDTKYESTDLAACLESTINLVWNELKYKVTLHRDYGAIPPTMCCPQQLGQVFMNLLINAAHAIERQGDITIMTRHEGDSILVSIADTGCGIPAENLARIFEPFFTTKEPGKGTGLGLSIVHDIVAKHKGKIAVASEPGKGATFTVRLPVVESRKT